MSTSTSGPFHIQDLADMSIGLPKDWTAICDGDPTGEGDESVVAYCHPDDAPMFASVPNFLAALRTIANSEEYHGDSFVCDFSTLKRIAEDALAQMEGLEKI